MVTQKRLTIPIFEYRLTVLVFDDWREVKHIFNEEYEPRAIVRSSLGSSVVAINSKKGSSIVHESEHIKNLIWDYIGYTPQRDNDEVDAYLINYIYNKIMCVYIKHNTQ